MDERSLFLTALEKTDPAERSAWLSNECAGDAALQQRIEALLKTHDDAGSFLERPPEDCVDPTAIPNVDTPDGPVSLDFLTPSSTPGYLGTLDYYEVLQVVGRGGMGIVLKARDSRLERIVAIKVLTSELAANPMARKRFSREAKAAAAVAHAHVVTIHGVDENRPYLVMEFVEGQSLKDKIDCTGPLELKEILRIGSQIAAGLAEAHKQGLIHRDIKPANILLENGVQRVKITDFGLARAVDDIAITRTGEVAGTPQFMSPEQAQGHIVDHRSDLFSLGSVLYTMCTGRSPFRADSTIAVIRRVCDDAPRPIRETNADVPEWLCDIVDKLLEKSPADRFQTAQEVSDLLAQHLAHVQQPTMVPAPPAVTPVRSNVDSETERKAVQSLYSPANGLIGTAILNFILLMGSLVVVAAVFGLPQFGALELLLLPVIIVGSALILMGGLRMLEAESYGFCVFAAVLAMLVPPGCFVIGWPVGIWSLIVLSRPDVRALFKSRERLSSVPPSTPAASAPPPGNWLWITVLLTAVVTFSVLMLANTFSASLHGFGPQIGNLMFVLWVVVVFWAATIQVRRMRGAQQVMPPPSRLRWLMAPATLLFVLLLGAGLAFWQVADRGTLVIESDDPKVTVEIGRPLRDTPEGGFDMKVVDRVTGSGDVRLRSGTYRLVSESRGFLITPGLFVLGRGERVVVKVFRVPPEPVGGPAGNQPRASEANWTPLFNGRDLTGWLTHPDEPGAWRAEEGTLTNAGQPAYLYSESREYGDFHLRCEVRINSGGDAGVILRAPFDRGKKEGLPGYDVQISAGTPLMAGWTTGAIASTDPQQGWRLLQKAETSVTPDEWFPLEVIARGNHIETWISGKKVAEYTDPQNRFARGRIVLQSSGGNTRVAFRKIEVRVPAAGQPTSVPGDSIHEKFVSQAGRFAVQFPGIPKEERIQPQGSISLFASTYEDGDGNGYRVSYADYPLDFRGGPRLFDAIRDDFTGPDGQVVSEKSLEFGPDKVAGRDMHVANGTHHIRDRVLWRNQRLYHVEVGGTEAFVNSTDAVKFINSFELLTITEKFVSQSGRFAVQAPGQARQVTVDKDTLKQHIFEWKLGDGNQYIVSYTGYPPDRIYPGGKTLFDAIRDDYKAKSWDVTSEADLQFGPDKVPARDLRLVQGIHYLRARLLWVNQRLYHVQADGTEEFAKNADADAFFESFELTPLSVRSESIPAPRAESAHPELEKFIQNAAARRDQTQARFKAGVAPMYEVLDAEAALIDARLRLAEALDDRAEQDRLLTSLVETRRQQFEIGTALYDAGRIRQAELAAIENGSLEAQLRLKKFRAAHLELAPVSAQHPANAP